MEALKINLTVTFSFIICDRSSSGSVCKHFILKAKSTHYLWFASTWISLNNYAFFLLLKDFEQTIEHSRSGMETDPNFF